MQARGHRRREVAKCHVSHEGKGQRGQRKCSKECEYRREGSTF